MEAAEKAEECATTLEEHRAASRCGVDEEAYLLLAKQQRIVPCRILDLSPDGCRVHTPERFLVASMMPVETGFKLQGAAFQISGMVQWTDCQHLAGIRFARIPRRLRRELIEALSEVKAEKFARAAEPFPEEQAAPERPAEEQPVETRAAEAQTAAPKPAPAVNPSEPEAPAQALAQTPVQVSAQAVTVQTSLPACAKPSKRERREAFREAVDTSAVIDLIRIASRLSGRILDLSLSGCRICTAEPFPVGIYTRIEVEFRLDGLPFRLGGVIQGIHDRRTVGIRFLDMSSRKREQVEQLMEEIQEKNDAGNKG